MRHLVSIGLAVAFTASTIVSIVGWFDGPSLGIRVALDDSGAYRVTEVFPGSIGWFADLKPGDTLTLVDGTPPTFDDLNGWVRGEELEAQAVNGTVLSGALESRAASRVGTFIGLVTTAFAFALAGVLIASRRIQTNAIRMVSWMLFLIGIAFVLGPSATLQRPFEQALEATVIPWAIAALMWTTCYGVRSGGRGIERAATLIAVAATILATILTIGWILTFSIESSFYAPVRATFFVTLTTLLMSSAVVVIVAWMRQRDRHLSKILKSLSAGFAFAVLPAVLFSYLPFLITGKFWLRPENTSVSMVFIPITIALTANRFRLFDIGAIANPRGMKIVVSAYVLVAIVAATIGIEFITHTSAPSAAMVGVIIAATTATVAFVTSPYMASLRARFPGKRSGYSSLLRDCSYVAHTAPDLRTLTTSVSARIRDKYGLDHVTISQQNTTRVESRPEIPKFVKHISIPGEHKGDNQVWVIEVGQRLDGEDLNRHQLDELESLAMTISSGVARLGMIQELSELNEKLVEVDEQARSLAAAEIHDEPLQLAHFLAGKLAESSDVELSTAAKVLARDLRALSSKLSSTPVSHLGFVEAIRDVVAEFKNRSGLRTELSINPAIEEALLPFRVQLSIYRVIQEALNNVYRHARATACWITIGTGESLQLEVSDNGVGLGGCKNDGLGLWGMRGRVETLGGSLKLSDRNGRGTTLTVVIPLLSNPAVDFRVNRA